ncbi:MAG TPA: peptidylprolyl isomerase [Bacteroidales bacterium]|nr:peptidylprolyl isomerase [Bacteroidales bacterium]
MKIKSLITLVALLLPMLCRGQDLNDKILMTVGGNKVDAGEFIRMYKKNTEPGKDQNIEKYLQQYIIFKLKVAEALKEGYDTTRSFRKELKGYRNQLAQNYLTDTLVKEKLLRKAYERSLKEINAWHILIALPSDASPEDTLKAWKKAIDVRQRIIQGESFEEVARSTSDDPSVKINGGNLGYFTVFQMIMPFEDAVYSMKKGEISKPVRTPYGYHIIKVADIRPSRGKIKVAHIMKAVPPGTDEEMAGQAKDEIDSIYNKLLKGASFAEMARKYSDHKASAQKGGELNWFGAGEIINDFADAAFAIKDTGDFTKPVRSAYGWHIIKLLDRKAPGTFNETRSYLESRLNKSYLNSLSKRSLIDKLKKEYYFVINQDAFDWFVDHTDTLIMQGTKKYDRSVMPVGNLYSFADRHLSTGDFADYIEKRGPMPGTSNPRLFVERSVDAISSENILSYENSVLEKKYPGFRYLMNEFHDGILLFDISSKMIWDKVTQDTTGLEMYYDEHKHDYLSKPGMEASIYTLKSPGRGKELFKMYKKYNRKENRDELLSARFNTPGDTVLFIKKGRWYKGDDSELDGMKWTSGYRLTTYKGYPAIIDITSVLAPQPKPLGEVTGEVMSAYQDYLDKKWIEQLKADYPVLIDDSVLKEIKKKLQNE